MEKNLNLTLPRTDCPETVKVTSRGTFYTIRDQSTLLLSDHSAIIEWPWSHDVVTPAYYLLPKVYSLIYWQNKQSLISINNNTNEFKIKLALDTIKLYLDCITGPRH